MTDEKKDEVITLKLIQECSRYAGNGYFIRPDASAKNPSPVLKAVDVRDFLLEMVEMLERLRTT